MPQRCHVLANLASPAWTVSCFLIPWRGQAGSQRPYPMEAVPFEIGTFPAVARQEDFLGIEREGDEPAFLLEPRSWERFSSSAARSLIGSAVVWIRFHYCQQRRRNGTALRRWFGGRVVSCPAAWRRSLREPCGRPCVSREAVRVAPDSLRSSWVVWSPDGDEWVEDMACLHPHGAWLLPRKGS